jgi:hypothetical protein
MNAMSHARPGPSISPEPTPEEAAAIIVALDALMPRQVVVDADAVPPGGNWRFSGRWWNLPIPVRRHRPWY